MDSSASSVGGVNLESTYDVFLSFRGEDTRDNFTSHLDSALRQKGVYFFIDDKLERGGQISKFLLKSIESSKISVVIFSTNYASSSWCLDELVKIIECMKSKGQIVLPVFYKVDPSEVRKQTGKYGEDMEKHEANELITNKIQPWKEALATAAGLSGWDLATRKNEADLIQDLIKEVLSILNQTQILDVAKYPVGIDSQLGAIEALVSHVVSDDGVNMVGIHGIGGIGKTTLAKALYNKISNEFEACSFLSNVREVSEQLNGLAQLQKNLLNEILKADNWKVGNVHRGKNIIRDRLCSKKVLIVIDDVDKDEQLDALVGGRDWFGRGSKIVATTRDRHLLEKHSFDKLHHVQLLDPNKSLELFCWHAFKQNCPSSNYVDLSKLAVDYCKGLPLALLLLGSFLHKREQTVWKSKLDELENSLEPGVEAVFQISFKGLEDKVKEIFLDISCFFVGENVNYIKNVLRACDLNPDYGITILIDLSLVTFEDGKIEMHDLVQQMGRTIVCRESSEPQKRSRLWVAEEIVKMLEENSGSESIKAIKLDLHNDLSLMVGREAFRNMKNLRLFIIKRDGEFSTNIFEHLPYNLKLFEYSTKFYNKLWRCSSVNYLVNGGIVGLVMKGVLHKQSRILFQSCKMLKHVDLSYGSLIEETTPNFAAALNLEKLYMRECKKLKIIHKSVAFLSKLVTLDLGGCINLEKFSSKYLMLKSLEVLNLYNCIKLEEIPDLSASSNLKELCLKGCSRLKIIHDSIGCSLDKLATLNLQGCQNLEKLPSYINKPESLEHLALSSCQNLENMFGNSVKKFPSHLKFKCLKILNLKYFCPSLKEITDFSVASNLEIIDLCYCSSLRMIDESIGSLDKLITLKLDYCLDLEELPSYLRLKSLVSLSLIGCRNLKRLPEFDENMKSLRWMDLSFTAIKELPSSIGYLIGLEDLTLYNCPNLTTLPNEIHFLKCLEFLQFNSSSKLDMFPPRLGLNFSDQQMSLCSKLTILDLQSCNISNLDFLETVSSVWTSLKFLNLSENKFCHLPSIDKFTSLEHLEIRNCKFLQDVGQLPHCLQGVNAIGSELLSTTSSDYIVNMIFGKQDHKFSDLPRRLVVKKSEIPKYCNNQTMEISSVGVRLLQHNQNKMLLPAMVVCIVFMLDGGSLEEDLFTCFVISMDDEQLFSYDLKSSYISKTEYMLLVRTLPMDKFDVNNKDDKHKCNIKVSITSGGLEKNKVIIRSQGVYMVDELSCHTNSN